MLAVHDRDELELVDGLGDLLYVMAGAFVAVHGESQDHTDDTFYRDPIFNPWEDEFIRHTQFQVAECVKIAADLNEQRIPYLKGIRAALSALHYTGYDAKGIFDEIHASNMTKTPTKGDIRVRVKGPDYRAPDLTRFLRGR